MRALGLCFIVVLGALIPPAFSADKTRYKALCSLYSPFEPCEVFLYPSGRITANIPRGYLDVDRRTIRSVEICDADVRCKPLLAENLEYVWKDLRISPFTAVVDFRMRYLNEFSKPKSVLLRFYNRQAAADFGGQLINISLNKSAQ